MTPLLPEPTVVNTDRSSVLAKKHGQDVSAVTGETEKTFREELDKQQAVKPVVKDKVSTDSTQTTTQTVSATTTELQDSNEQVVETTEVAEAETETDTPVTVVDADANTNNALLDNDSKTESEPSQVDSEDDIEGTPESVLQVLHTGKPLSTDEKTEEGGVNEPSDITPLNDPTLVSALTESAVKGEKGENGNSTSRILELMTSYRIKSANSASGSNNSSIGQTVSDVSLTSKVSLNSSVGEQGVELKPVSLSNSELSLVNQNPAAKVSKPLTATQLANALNAKSQNDNAPLSVSFAELLKSSVKGEPSLNLNEHSSFQAVNNLTSASPSPLSTEMRMQIDIKVGQPQWAQALAERTANLAGQNIQFAEIQLDPPELGPLQVKVAVSHDHATVSFASAHQSVRDGIDQSIFRLKELLGEQGVNLVDVDVSDHSFEQQQQGTGDGEQSGSVADGVMSSDVVEEEIVHTNVQLDYAVDYFV